MSIARTKGLCVEPDVGHGCRAVVGHAGRGPAIQEDRPGVGPGGRDVPGCAPRESLGPVPELDEPVVGGGQRHRPQHALRRHREAPGAGGDHPAGRGGHHGRAHRDGVQRDDRLQAAERQSGPLPVRDRGRHDLGLERRGAGDRDVHGPRRRLQGRGHRHPRRGELPLRRELQREAHRRVRHDVPQGPIGARGARLVAGAEDTARRP